MSEEIIKEGWLKHTGIHDVMFKKLISGEYGHDLICEIFNQVCPGYGVKPDEIISLNTELADYVELKSVRLDVLFSFRNVKVNIESQRTKPNYDFSYRIDLYTSKLQNSQENRGENYEEKRPVIVISICGFDALDNGKWITIIKPLDIEDLNGYCYKWKTNIYLQLPYIENCSKMWVKEFFKMMSSHYPEDYKGRDEMMDNTIKEIKRLNSDKVTLDEIARYEDAYHSYHADMNINFKKGKAEGIVEGIEQGKVEATKETAKKMKELGLSDDIIYKSTGLSLEEINKL